MSSPPGVVVLASPTKERGSGGAAAEVSRVDVHEMSAARVLNAMNENIGSLGEVDFLAYGIARPSTLVSLSLHSNRLSSLEGFASMTALTALNLSSNELDGEAIRSCAPHLGPLASLESLDLSCNRIDGLLGLPFLPGLRRLLVPYNRLTSLDGVQALASSLTHLDARDNRIAGPAGAHAPHLAALGRLESLALASVGRGRRVQPNPICACRGYREDVFAAARSLKTLDGENASFFFEDRETAATPAEAAAKRESGARAQQQRRSVAAAADVTEDTPAASEPGGDRNAAAETAIPVAAVTALVAPEEVPIAPRFDALAGRFRHRRRRRPGVAAEGGGGRGRCLDDDDDDEMSSRRVAVQSAGVESSSSDAGWSEGDGDGLRESHAEGFDADSFGVVGSAGRVDTEETAARAVPGRRKDGGGGRGIFDGESGVREALGEDVAEEHGLLSRLRSVAQEARLEVMDSRLQDLHDKQAQDTARHAATAARATAALRRSVSNTTRGQAHEAGAAGPTRRGSRSNPWAQHGDPQQRGVAGKGVVPRTVRGTGSTVPLRSNGNTAVADRPVRWTRASGDCAAIGNGGFGSRGGVTQPPAAVARPEDVCGGEASVTARCSCCGGQDASELTLQAARGGGCTPPGEPGGVGAKPLESSGRRHLADASTQANRGPGPLSSGPARTRRVSVTPSAGSFALWNAGTGKSGSSPSTGGLSIGGAVAAAALVGATAAALSGHDGHRLASSFSRWARDTDRARAAAAAAAADEALAGARREAERERKAWESVQAALEGSAAAREREARESAQEEGREEMRSMAAACRSAEETASSLELRLAQAETDAAAAVLGQQQAQADVIRAKTDAEASVKASEARATAEMERLEGQLRGKARAESEAEEECRRVRSLLREAESRCRGLQDQVEESRARERRASTDADDARRRAALDADKKLVSAVDSERDRIVVLKHKLEAAEDAARAAAKAARASAEGEARGRRAAAELADLAREQKAALQVANGEIRAARTERIGAQEAMEAMKAEAARNMADMKEIRDALEAREATLAAERQARRQCQQELEAAVARAKALDQEKEDAEAKMMASAIAQGDLRAAVMVKDKVLEDREKLVKELRLREGDALAEAQAWRDRLDAQQAESDQRLDAAREEVSELEAQVVALSGVEDQLREVFKELRRYRKRHESEDDGKGDGGGGDDRQGGESSRDGSGRRQRSCSTELTAVAAVTAAAKAVEEELRAQLEAKDQALRYVENELLGMKSLFESKEACLRQELGEERDKLAGEVGVLRQRLEQAEESRAAAEESARQHASTSGALRSSLRNGDRRSKEVQ
ncbi:Hypothetical leucine rich repeat protein [Ectocarpus siliculosus]|uniref:Hypothetical leucine rich repeat protein n=1 Tax=Ectocarpus siliculosus TaxID=2880 RepID=D7FK56_ECTSI|nr:Hypothetical leucine rich repeat protein [Ectocarpus siliculosus]|eukprot:CBJ29266.1 Hypothetical leucine rich repeat protein [Ectocarpus siliculosus]